MNAALKRRRLAWPQQALSGQVVDRRHAVRLAEDAPQVAVGHPQLGGDVG
jgi:hypothetical protein